MAHERRYRPAGVVVVSIVVNILLHRSVLCRYQLGRAPCRRRVVRVARLNDVSLVQSGSYRHRPVVLRRCVYGRGPGSTSNRLAITGVIYFSYQLPDLN